MESHPKSEAEHILKHLVTMTETTLELGDKIALAEQYVCYLKNVAAKEARVVMNLKNITKCMLHDAMKVAQANIKYLEAMPANNSNLNYLRSLYERLNSLLEKGTQPEDTDYLNILMEDCDLNLSAIHEKITAMESKQKSEIPTHWSSSHVSLKLHKQETDEKYPGSCSKDSLLDFESGSSLPPVPEDTFTNFKVPPRTCSLSSIKTIKKMKHTLRQYEENNNEADKNNEVLHEMENLDQ